LKDMPVLYCESTMPGTSIRRFYVVKVPYHTQTLLLTEMYKTTLHAKRSLPKHSKHAAEAILMQHSSCTAMLHNDTMRELVQKLEEQHFSTCLCGLALQLDADVGTQD